jgi:hybrid cluster-associated redox disulfide protein
MKVTRNTIIADVLEKHSDVGMLLFESGLHCVGCAASSFETIEDGCKVHGFSDEEIDKLIDKINDEIKLSDKA